MSRLQELIQTLCPDGVEYKRLGSLCDLSRGKVYSRPYITAHAGNYPVYSSQTANDGELGRISTYDYDGEYLTWTTDGAYAGTIFHRKGKFSITNVCGLIAVKFPEILNLRFLYYWLSIKAQEYVYRGMGNPKLMSNQMAPIEIPIPPLAVQEEIVRILDAFTSYAAELQAELQARKEQYAYYRDQLLTFDEHAEGVEWKKLGEVLHSIRTGLNPRNFFKLNTPDATSYYVTIREFNGGNLIFTESTDRINETARELCNNRSHLECNDVLFSGTGTIGETYVIDNTPSNWNIKEGVYSLKPKIHLILPKYLKYILSQSEIKANYIKLAEGGTVKSISMKKLGNFSIPIPPIQEQQRIVSILDKFEALVNDLTEGLPAEIAAVQEQYEYYRNKLLSFPKITEA